MQWHSLPMLVHPQNFELSAAQLPGISKVAAFAFEFTSEAFEGGGWKSQPRSHLFTSGLKGCYSLQTPFRHRADQSWGGQHFSRVQKNVLVPLFVNVSEQQRQEAGKEGPCCAGLQLLCWGKKGTPGAAARESASTEHPGSSPSPSQVPRDPSTPRPREGLWASFGEQLQGSEQRQQGCKANLISSEGCRILLPWFCCQKCLEG